MRAPPGTGRSGRRIRVAVLGGTFDHLHAGHRALLAAAFARAPWVRVGLTTDAFVRQERKPAARKVQSYVTRRRRLRQFLAATYPGRRWTIAPLADPWGGSVQPGADLIVVSAETRAAVRVINRERRRRKLPPLAACVVPLVRAEDGRPIASRRIRTGEIDPEGRLRRAEHGRSAPRRSKA